MAVPHWAPRIASRFRDAVVCVLPSDLLLVLAVAGVESAEKAPGITLNKLGGLRDKLMGRLDALGPGGVVRGMRVGGLCGNVQGLVEGTAPDGPGGDWGAGRRRAGGGHRGGRWELGSRFAVFLSMYCVILNRSSL